MNINNIIDIASVTPVFLIVTTYFVIEAVKKAEIIPKKFLALSALILGLFLGIIVGIFTELSLETSIFTGILAGGFSVGLYESIKNLFTKNEEVGSKDDK